MFFGNRQNYFAVAATIATDSILDCVIIIERNADMVEIVARRIQFRRAL